MSKKLYVGNLPYSTTKEELAALFSNNGEVAGVEATIISDRETGRSKGFGFVEFQNDADADAAISKFGAESGFQLEGRTLVVNEARPREERPRNNFGGGNRGFGGGYGGGNRDRGNRGGDDYGMAA